MAKPQSKVEKKQPQYGSDVVVDLMKAFEIEYAAFNPGATFRGIHDSIVNYGGNYKPEVIFCHHEEISVAVAHGYAKAKNKPMIAIAHNMVGLQHASMAIFNAYIDRVPIMVLGGTGPMNSKRRRPRIDWIHTALVQGNQVRDYVKWDDQPYSLADVPDSFIRGYRIATTDPMAPVYINYDADIQEDALASAMEVPDVSRYAAPAPTQANPDALKRAARMLVDAQAPLIIADTLGRNPKNVAALIELAELLATPVVDKGARFNFPSVHPLDVTDGAREILQRADVILALDVGDLFGSLTTVSKQTRNCEYVSSPAVKIISISMNDMLVHSWANDYQALQAVDVPMTADTSVAVKTMLLEQDVIQRRHGAVNIRFGIQTASNLPRQLVNPSEIVEDIEIRVISERNRQGRATEIDLVFRSVDGLTKIAIRIRRHRFPSPNEARRSHPRDTAAVSL